MEKQKILLVRHGLTEANEKNIYCGATDLPLTENGRKKLAGMRKIYEGITPVKAKYFTSGMKRANETFEILFATPDKARSYTVIPDFRELNFGRFEMRSYENLKDDEEFVSWISAEDYEAYAPPEGESGNQMSERVVAAFEKLICENSEEDLVVVSHGGTIYYIMKYLFPEENKNIFEWQPKNGCGYLLERDKSGYTYKAVE